MSGDRGTDIMASTHLDFTKAVLMMDHDLHEEDVESLKFLCQGLVVGSKLKPVQAVHELATLLKEQNHVSDEDFFLLADLLQFIGRVDVLVKLGFMEEQVISWRQRHQSKIDAFYVLLFDIAEDLKIEDVKKAVFTYEKAPLKHTMSHGLDLFSFMIKRRDIGPQDVRQLVAIFQELERPDFVDKLNKYKETGGQSVLLEIERAFQNHRKKFAQYDGCCGDTGDMNSVAAQQAVSTSRGSQVRVQPNPSAAGDALPGQEQDIADDLGKLDLTTTAAAASSGESDEQANGRSSTAVPDRPGMSHDQPPSDSPLEYYRMDRNPRGWCIIINIKKFVVELPQAVEQRDRPYSDFDKDRLMNTFKQLNFKIKIEENLSSSKMVKVLKRLALKDHSNYDCFVCCILSHGKLGAVYGGDGIAVPIHKLTSCVHASACSSLAGKPKLFFLQACQGLKRMGGVAVPSTEEDAYLGSDGPEEQIPDEADFLIGYPTGPGFPAYYSESRGGLYIKKLTEILDKYACRYDILQILTLVNKEVGKENPKGYKQIPAPIFSLRKTLIFK